MLHPSDFNELNYEQKCRVLRRFGQFHSCRGLEAGKTINLYELEGLWVELWLDPDQQAIWQIKAVGGQKNAS